MYSSTVLLVSLAALCEAAATEHGGGHWTLDTVKQDVEGGLPNIDGGLEKRQYPCGGNYPILCGSWCLPAGYVCCTNGWNNNGWSVWCPAPAKYCTQYSPGKYGCLY